MSYAEFPMVAALEAVAACERLAAQLSQLGAWLDQAASVARADWSGPHRDTFDHRVAVIDDALLRAGSTLNVLRARVDRELPQQR